MRQFRSAIEYYEVAMRLDGSMISILQPIVDRLKVMERVVENAEANGLPVESVLALIDEY
jgi:hypothetical protein